MNDLAADLEPPTTSSGARDYERIARAIGFLRRHASAQPDLAAVARHVHLSEHHFQRLFTRWAGVSPKRFLQHLTVEHAKARLAASRNTLELAGDVGLSGPGRLHELFVTIEAMSPGEYRSGGAGQRIGYGIVDSPFGPCLIASTARGICTLRFLDGEDGASDIERDWPQARLELNEKTATALAQRIFGPLRSPDRPLALLVKGTNFQVQVWRALLNIPFGTLSTYGGLARTIGRPSAARAVGAAVGANPVAWLVPCHRVIRESGELGGYRWGVERKAAMLGWEAAYAG